MWKVQYPSIIYLYRKRKWLLSDIDESQFPKYEEFRVQHDYLLSEGGYQVLFQIMDLFSYIITVVLAASSNSGTTWKVDLYVNVT